MNKINDKGFHERMRQIEALIEKIDAAADSPVKSSALALMQSLMELHGAAIERIIEIARAQGEPGQQIINRLASDSLVASLLALYDLNPINLVDRIKRALENIDPYLQAQGGKIELLAIDNGIARLRVASGNGQAFSPALRRTIEDAIYQIAPDIKRLEFEEAAPPVQLIQLRRKKAQPLDSDRCELCSEPLTSVHQHLFEPAKSKLFCACDACALLFCSQERGKYRRVTRRASDLSDFHLTDEQWQALMIPIGIAFFYYNSSAEKIAAIYPSPAGPIETTLPLQSWQELARNNSRLAKMQPDVEALLVNRLKNSSGQTEAEYFLVSIDHCYRLIGLVRANWQGLSGGPNVWPEIKKFFLELKQHSD
jgi:Fe-S cluster biogenesis protein NfuA